MSRKDFALVDAPDMLEDGTIYDNHLVFDDNGLVVPGTVVSLHNNLIKCLRSQYPAFKDYWKIRINTQGGIVQIWNMAISGEWGIELKITSCDPENKRLKDEVGKYFEIFNVARGRQLSISQAMAHVEADRLGRLKHKV